jgi:hypothetical protein
MGNLPAGPIAVLRGERNKRRTFRFRRMLEEATHHPVSGPLQSPLSLQTSAVHARNRTIGFVMLIKKKDVNEYFAARRRGHPLSAKPAPAGAPTRSSKVKPGSKAVSSTRAIGIPDLPPHQ